MILSTLLLLSVANAEVQISAGRRAMSGITSDDISADSFLSKTEIDDIRRRRLVGEEIPDEYYERCHFWVNAVRARESLPALKRWTELESCTDDMSEYDYFEYRDNGRPHAAMQDGVGCDFFNNGVSGYAQNSCPLWPNSADSISGCMVAMWEEKEDPGVYIQDDRMYCNGHDSLCGHYYTLRGGRDASAWYNNYDRVACGFYIHPTAEDNDALYINKNFGAPGWKGPQEFLCGGDASQQPVSPLLSDCMDRSNDYTDCNGGDKNYDEYGCDWRTCDTEYDGECEDFHSACDFFEIEEGKCNGRIFWDHTGATYNFATTCRKSCGNCSCEGVPVHPGDGGPMDSSEDPNEGSSCDNAQSGKLKGKKKQHKQVDTPCDCEATCILNYESATYFQYFAKKKKCFCFDNPKMNGDELHVKSSGKYVYSPIAKAQ